MADAAPSSRPDVVRALLRPLGLSLSDVALGAAMLDKAARLDIGQTLRYR